MVVYGLANTLFGVKDDRLLKLLSKITRLCDIVCRINSCYLSRNVLTIYVCIYSNSSLESYTIYYVIDTFTGHFT